MNNQDLRKPPFPSWTLDEFENWQAPIPLPEDENIRAVGWDENTLSWITENRNPSGSL